MVTHATHDPPRGVSTHSKPEQRDLYVAATGTPAHIWPRCECDSFCSGPPTSTKPVKTAVPFRRDKIRGIGVTLSRKRELCPENGSAVLKRVLRSSEACFGRGGPANYLELELICPQNGSAVLKKLLRSSEACFGRGAPANYLELELTCPQNGRAVLKKL